MIDYSECDKCSLYIFFIIRICIRERREKVIDREKKRLSNHKELL